MIILGIESSCDDTGAAIVKDGRKILSSVVNSQIEKHKIYGGVVPEIASRCHCESIVNVVNKALIDANLTLNDIDAIGVTYAPGLIGSLLVGVNFAKGLSLATNIPIVPVHHIRGHIAANYLTFSELTPPFLCLVVSGGHTNIIEVKDYNNFNIIGKTHDDAAGETFDKVARVLGMPYPGGIHLDKVAKNGNPYAFALPKPHVSDSKYDFSLSGLKTAAINKIHKAKQKGEIISIEDMSASFRNVAVEYLIEKLMLSAKDYKYTKIAACGGVCANSLLRERLKSECKKNNYELYIPELQYCGDNAAMIASQAYYEFLKNNISDLSLNAKATMPIKNCLEDNL